MSNVSRHGAAACSGSSPEPGSGSDESLEEENERLRFELEEKKAVIRSLSGLLTALEAVAPEIVTAMKKQWLVFDYTGTREKP
ncbi:hypothetical protein [Streptomyces sp. CoH17]|uniref:hypothetical protein n=1 Tax=Streptomyces sp. CoH17 TaxID=2992806 RepID=UPI00227157D9|nr:hypothetical protein [Streptomyces sp. CoH17]